MYEILLILICLAILIVGSGTDIKWNEVPDWLNFAGIAAGFGIRAIVSNMEANWDIFLYGLYGFGAMFLIACILFYLGQWGGGDSKLLMAVGALLGLEFTWDNLLLAFLVFAMIAGAFYGFVWSLVLGITNRKKVVPRLRQLLSKTKYYQAIIWVLAVIIAGFGFAINDAVLSLGTFILAVLLVLLLYSALFTRTIEQSCMLKLVSPEELTEGDWIAKQVVVKGKKIAGPNDLGISKKQIAELKRKKVKSVLVKNGIPFVPALLIAFVLALLFGNVLQYLF